MVNNLYSISETSLASLEKQILKTAQVLDDLRKKLILSMPAKYGSDLWWEKEEILADQETAQNKVKKYKDAKAFIKHLDKLAQ